MSDEAERALLAWLEEIHSALVDSNSTTASQTHYLGVARLAYREAREEQQKATEQQR